MSALQVIFNSSGVRLPLLTDDVRARSGEGETLIRAQLGHGDLPHAGGAQDDDNCPASHRLPTRSKL